MTASASNTKYYVKLTITLFVIAAVVALCLGLVNSITKDPIAQHKAETARNAMSQVLAAEAYTEVSFTDDTGTVQAVYQAGQAGYVVDLIVGGCQDMIELMVGVDNQGVVTGVSIVDHAETSGLGANCTKEEFRSQYVGTTGNLAVNKDGGTIDALTGATITSRAVTRAVNNAVACVQGLL